MTIALFKKYLKEKSSVTEAELELIESVCQVKRVRRRQYLLQEGDVWKYHCFVAKGCLRTYTVDQAGNEHIIYFAIENWWTGDRESLVTAQPSMYNIDALEDSEVILISIPNFERICTQVPAFYNMVNAILQNSFIVAQRRIHTHISLTAEEKYLRFMETSSHLNTRIPQSMIASYLGITPETLSRIRRQTVKKS